MVFMDERCCPSVPYSNLASSSQMPSDAMFRKENIYYHLFNVFPTNYFIILMWFPPTITMVSQNVILIHSHPWKKQRAPGSTSSQHSIPVNCSAGANWKCLELESFPFTGSLMMLYVKETNPQRGSCMKPLGNMETNTCFTCFNKFCHCKLKRINSHVLRMNCGCRSCFRQSMWHQITLENSMRDCFLGIGNGTTHMYIYIYICIYTLYPSRNISLNS